MIDAIIIIIIIVVVVVVVVVVVETWRWTYIPFWKRNIYGIYSLYNNQVSFSPPLLLLLL